jgi:hypothetical protein
MWKEVTRQERRGKRRGYTEERESGGESEVGPGTDAEGVRKKSMGYWTGGKNGTVKGGSSYANVDRMIENIGSRREENGAKSCDLNWKIRKKEEGYNVISFACYKMLLIYF